MSGETVRLAYWAPIYVVVNVDRRQVISVRVVTSGMRSAPRIGGEVVDQRRRQAAAIVDDALAQNALPKFEIS